jgi:hypothetical protein
VAAQVKDPMAAASVLESWVVVELFVVHGSGGAG